MSQIVPKLFKSQPSVVNVNYSLCEERADWRRIYKERNGKDGKDGKDGMGFIEEKEKESCWSKKGYLRKFVRSRSKEQKVCKKKF